MAPDFCKLEIFYNSDYTNVDDDLDSFSFNPDTEDVLDSSELNASWSRIEAQMGNWSFTHRQPQQRFGIQGENLWVERKINTPREFSAELVLPFLETLHDSQYDLDTDEADTREDFIKLTGQMSRVFVFNGYFGFSGYILSQNKVEHGYHNQPTYRIEFGIRRWYPLTRKDSNDWVYERVNQ